MIKSIYIIYKFPDLFGNAYDSKMKTTTTTTTKSYNVYIYVRSLVVHLQCTSS